MVSPLGGIIAGISLRGDWLNLALFCAICSIFIGWWRIFFAFRRVKKGVGSESQLWRDAMNIARCSSRSAFSVHGSMLRDSYRAVSSTEEKESVGTSLQRDADYWIPEISAAEMIETKATPPQRFATYFTAIRFEFYSMVLFAFVVRWIRDFIV